MYHVMQSAGCDNLITIVHYPQFCSRKRPRSHHPRSKQALDELVEVAGHHATPEVTEPVVTSDEVTELIKIKKLLQLKGTDKVLQFLEQA